MKKPVIGVTPLFDMEKDSVWMLPGYMEALTACGALPVILSFDSGAETLERTLGICDGFLFTGGQDVSPSLYGEEPIPACGEAYPPKDRLEAGLFRLAYGADKPIFGICRGIQLINAVLGGSLWQDIPHHKMTPPYDRVWHRINLNAGGPLRELLRVPELGVNSYHHQGIKTLAPSLLAMAEAPDGLVEAVYAPEKRFVWAVQWHPEFSWRTDGAEMKIIRRFVEMC